MNKLGTHGGNSETTLRDERKNRSDTEGFYNGVIQTSLSELLRNTGFDYAGIWLPSREWYIPMYEVGKTALLKNSACLEQIRLSELSATNPLLCPTDSHDGGVDVVFRFRDAMGNPFAYVLLDDISKARRLSEAEVSGFLSAYYAKTHVMLLESRIFALESRLEGIRYKLDEAEERSNVDGLTGLLVRRRIMEILSEKVSALPGSPEGSSVAVCLSDIDHFKKVNDTHGHQTWDEVLRKVAGIVNDGYHANGHAHTRRKQDTFGRYGGEEFVFVLPNTPLRNAAAYCEKVRRIVEGAVFENSFGERFGVTISIGVAEITRLEAQLAGEEGLENLIKSAVGEADARMYAAKRWGRNSVVWKTPQAPIEA